MYDVINEQEHEESQAGQSKISYASSATKTKQKSFRTGNTFGRKKGYTGAQSYRFNSTAASGFQINSTQSQSNLMMQRTAAEGFNVSNPIVIDKSSTIKPEFNLTQAMGKRTDLKGNKLLSASSTNKPMAQSQNNFFMTGVGSEDLPSDRNTSGRVVDEGSKRRILSKQ